MGLSPHIAVHNVTQVFATEEDSLTALTNVNLMVERGVFLSVIGPSGAGKTTLLKVIGGLLEPTSGTVLLDGEPPSHARRHKSVGFVFQDPGLLPWRTVAENIKLPLQVNVNHINGHVDDPERLLEAVGLARFRDYYPHQLSGGMRQRVALARALVLDPSVLLMDEPLGALDEMTRDAMRYELLRLWERSRQTVVFVTHSIPEAVIMSDRVAVMSVQPGRILQDVEIDLPRPRGESLERSGRFMEYVRRIKEALWSGDTIGSPTPEARAEV